MYSRSLFKKSAALVLSSLLFSSQLPLQAATSHTTKTEAEAYVDHLLKQMTLTEKIGQMSQLAMNDREAPLVEERIRKEQVGSLLFITDPEKINRLQHIAVDETRLHIPLIIGFDVVHGFRTIYPIPLAMASSWDPSLAEHAQSMAAREARSVGVDWAFAPMVDIARDARWGRIMEGAGEDPYLGSQMAAAQVRGFQGNDLAANDRIMACVKHFAAYGAAPGGRDYDSVDVSEEQLWNVYLKPYQAAIQAGAGSLMSAYMDFNGVPATGNPYLLHDVLRTNWKFKGFVVSDWESVRSMTTHGFTENDEAAAVQATNAGVDMEMTSHVMRDNLEQAVKQGRVKETTIDDAVRYILLAKYKLGLFQNPYVDVSRAQKELVSAEQRKAARETATKTAVLLRNEGHLLPLKDPQSIAVIGPLADSQADTMGSWSLAGHPADTITILHGIRNRFPHAKIESTAGVEIVRPNASIFDAQFPSPKPKLTTDAERRDEFTHAIDLVKSTDVTVMVLGEAQNMNGERAARSTLTLPGQQQELLEAAVATGKPVVLILLTGRPLNITWASEHVPAILNAWYPGTEGGNAVADILAGDANPGGKLTVSWPRSVGQLPLYYARNLTQIPNDLGAMYWDAPSTPLYPFGYGLTYSSFTMDHLQLQADKVKAGADLTASVEVENTSDTDGDEIVQLYTHQRFGGMSHPVRELKGFRRVHLRAHEKQTVTLTLETKELAFWNPITHTSGIEPGLFDLWMGDSSAATLHQQFTVTP